MPDFATITGITGAVTGVIALIVSIKNYVRVSAMKALDLRLELQKSFNDLDLVLSGIESYLDFVHQSHLRVLAATGRNRSGEMRMFEEDFANDKARLRGLLGTQPRREDNYEARSPINLEKALVCPPRSPGTPSSRESLRALAAPLQQTVISFATIQRICRSPATSARITTRVEHCLLGRTQALRRLAAPFKTCNTQRRFAHCETNQ